MMPSINRQRPSSSSIDLSLLPSSRPPFPSSSAEAKGMKKTLQKGGRREELFRIDAKGNPPIARADLLYLAFGAGSVRGLALISAFEELCNVMGGSIPHLRGVAGTSAGSMLALGVAAGLSPAEMRTFADLPFLYQVIDKLEWKRNGKAISFVNKQLLRDKLEDLLRIKGLGPDTTFRQLYRVRNIELKVATIDLAADKVVIWSTRDTPDAFVVDAVMASSSMPFVFRPEFQRTAKGECKAFVDGAGQMEIPFRLYPPEHTLGIYLYDAHRNPKVGYQLFSSLTDQERNHMISIDVSRLGSLEFAMSPELARFITLKGTNAVRTYFHLQPIPFRPKIGFCNF